jgi:hypothetical protein
MKKLMLIALLIAQPCFAIMKADEAAKKSMAAKEARLKALAGSLEKDMEKAIDQAISQGEFTASVQVDEDCDDTKKIGIGEKLSHLDYRVSYDSSPAQSTCTLTVYWF